MSKAQEQFAKGKKDQKKYVPTNRMENGEGCQQHSEATKKIDSKSFVKP